MKLLLNADDFGLTRSGTDAILDCVDNGPLNSVSILANGASFEYAIAELVKRPGLTAGIHINLIMQHKKIGLEINLKSIRDAGFVVESLLLDYAKIVVSKNVENSK